MGLSKKHLQGLATGFQLGGVVLVNLDSDQKGADDQIGKALQVGGIALAQLAAGESVSRKGKAAEALRAIGAAVSSLADELEAGG